MVDPREIWKIEVEDKVYSVEFAEIASWISEGILLEETMVKRGELRWLEAGRVPLLNEFFEAKANGTEAPYVPPPQQAKDEVVELTLDDIHKVGDRF